MSYYKVPVTDGILDIDYADLVEGIHYAENECYVKLREGVQARGSWVEIIEEDFISKKAEFEPPT
jgi:hypothetical protein